MIWVLFISCFLMHYFGIARPHGSVDKQCAPYGASGPGLSTLIPVSRLEVTALHTGRALVL